MQLLCNKIKGLFWEGGGTLTIFSVHVLESMLSEEEQLRAWVSHDLHTFCLRYLFLLPHHVHAVPKKKSNWSDSASCSTCLVFLGVATVPSLPQGLRGFLHGTHMGLFPIRVFYPLTALSVFVFLKSVKFFLQTVLAVWNCKKHKRQSWQQRLLGWGSTVLQVVSSHRNSSPTPFSSPVPTYKCSGIATLIPLLYLLILLPCL